MHLSIASPIPPPGAHGASGGDLSSSMCTTPDLWGITFEADPRGGDMWGKVGGGGGGAKHPHISRPDLAVWPVLFQPYQLLAL